MPKYELAICVADEPDHRADAKRKKEGDVVNVHEHPFQTGRVPMANCLFVIIETSATFETLETMVHQYLYWDKVNSKIVSEVQYRFLTDKESGGTRSPSDFEIYTKHRLSISLADIKNRLPDLDLIKVRNKNYIYQPFKRVLQLMELFTPNKYHEQVMLNGKLSIKRVKQRVYDYTDVLDPATNKVVTIRGNPRDIDVNNDTPAEIDCVSSLADNDTEFSINLDVIPAIIYDKFQGKLIKP